MAVFFARILDTMTVRREKSEVLLAINRLIGSSQGDKANVDLETLISVSQIEGAQESEGEIKNSE